jgi:hypothetical protein
VLDMPIRQFIKGEMGSADINRLTIAYAKGDCGDRYAALSQAAT